MKVYTPTFTSETEENIALSEHINEKLFDELQNTLSIINDSEETSTLILKYYARLLEVANDCLNIFRCKLVASVPIIIRSLFELLIDIVHLVKNPSEYYTLLKFQELKGSKKERADLINILENVAPNYIKKYNKNGKDKIGAISIFKKITLATEESYTNYAKLCSDVHNNLSTISRSHTVGNEKEDQKEYLFCSEMLICIICNGANEVYKFYGLDSYHTKEILIHLERFNLIKIKDEIPITNS